MASIYFFMKQLITKNKILGRFVKQLILKNMPTYLYSLNYVKMNYLMEIVRYDEI